jgi:hypothetical protein
MQSGGYCKCCDSAAPNPPALKLQAIGVLGFFVALVLPFYSV